MYRVYEEAGLQDITMHLYEDDRHEILNEPDKEKVMADIAEWIAKCLAIRA